MGFEASDRVLVVGGTGFIGRHLVRRCLQDTPHVTCLSLGTRDRSTMASTEGTLELCDLTDSAATRVALDRTAFHYVFNLGGYIDHRPYPDGGRKVIEAHFTGLMNLIDALDQSSLRGFIQIGSSDEYGDVNAPQSEGREGRAVSPYALAKSSSTRLVQMLAERDGFPGVVLRLFLVYGPGQDQSRLVPQIVTACVEGQSFPVSPGEQLRDFCFVEDIVEGMIKAALTEGARAQVVNLASGVPVAIRDLVQTVVGLVGQGTPLFGARPYRAGESMALVADVRKARTLLDWTPPTDLRTGLIATITESRERLAQCKS